MHERIEEMGPVGPRQEVTRVADRLNHVRLRSFVGRQRELEQLEQCAEPDGPAVTFLHGIGGMGKSTLLEVLAERFRARGVRSICLDARGFEPTPHGFWRALGGELGLSEGGSELAEPESETLSVRVAAALAAAPSVSVLIIDHYELLRLLDSWLRKDFAPHLPAPVRLILSGRYPPTAGWNTTMGWQALVRTCTLQALDEVESRALLERRQAPQALVSGIVKFAQGHPLALELALAAVAERPGFDFEASDRSRVIARLAQLFLRDLADIKVRAALEATSVVRRASRSFLASLMGEGAASQAIEDLGDIGFIERTAEGLSLHPSVRQALDGELRAIDPIRHRELRRAAWQHMRRALPSVGRAHLWQHAADALFLLERDLIREAFFPSAHDPLVVQCAEEDDLAEIASIASAYDSTKGVAVIRAFFRHARHTLHVARSESGEVLAFYVLARSDRVDERLRACDPLIARWVDHRPGGDAPALFLRRLLARPAHASRADAYAACVLDLKRSYIENPRTTRLYAAASDVRDHPEWGPLGFREISELSAPGLSRDGGPHSTFCLEFGVGGIFGWIGRLVDAQFQSPEPHDASKVGGVPERSSDAGLHLDEDSRRLVLDGAEVPLTKLQWNLLRHLSNNRARVIERDELVQAVWGLDFVGSNVVDAAIRSLRKKLGAHAAAIETVKGFGYRFRATPNST